MKGFGFIIVQCSCLLALLLLANCKPKPTACFTTAGTVAAGDSQAFTNCSKNADTYSWNFGDGTTATEANPTHIYGAAGIYTVQLTASKSGEVSTTQQQITVTGLAAADFTGTWTSNDETCTSGAYPNYAITITGDTVVNKIRIRNIYSSTETAQATFLQQTITIPDQNFGNATISGTGTLSNDKLSITLAYTITASGSTESCNTTFNK